MSTEYETDDYQQMPTMQPQKRKTRLQLMSWGGAFVRVAPTLFVVVYLVIAVVMFANSNRTIYPIPDEDVSKPVAYSVSVVFLGLLLTQMYLFGIEAWEFKYASDHYIMQSREKIRAVLLPVNFGLLFLLFVDWAGMAVRK